jgi:FlaA1/EpsC-like NDP-sugar epimerase
LKENKIHIRSRYLIAIDAIALCASVALAYMLGFERFWLSPDQTRTALIFAAVIIPLKLALFIAAGLYRRIWHYASIAELERIVGGLGIATVASVFVGGLLLPDSHLVPVHIPWAVLALDSLLSASLIVAPRLFYRVVSWHGQRRHRNDHARAIIVGAGAAGQMIAKELLSNHTLGICPVAFADDDERKANHRLHELPVLGRIDDIGKIAAQQGASIVVIAMPSAPGLVIRRVVRVAAEAGLKTRILPSLSDMLSGRASGTSLRDVRSRTCSVVNRWKQT